MLKTKQAILYNPQYFVDQIRNRSMNLLQQEVLQPFSHLQTHLQQRTFENIVPKRVISPFATICLTVENFYTFKYTRYFFQIFAYVFSKSSAADLLYSGKKG